MLKDDKNLRGIYNHLMFLLHMNYTLSKIIRNCFKEFFVIHLKTPIETTQVRLRYSDTGGTLYNIVICDKI